MVEDTIQLDNIRRQTVGRRGTKKTLEKKDQPAQEQIQEEEEEDVNYDDCQVKLLSQEEIDAIRAQNEVKYPSIYAPAFVDFDYIQ